MADATKTSRCSLRSPRWENLDLLEEEGFPYTTKLLKGGKKVLLTDSIVGVHDAMRVCEAVCGKLFLPRSANENQEAADFIRANGATHVWLRTSDRYEEGTWKDLDTLEDIKYTNWSRGDPNNWDGVQDYVVMNKYGRWNDFYQYADNSDVCFSMECLTYVSILCELPAKIQIKNRD